MKENNVQDSVNKKINKKTIVVTFFLIALIIIGISIIVMLLKNNKNVGNTIGNIRNFGAAAEDNKYIYFKSYSKDGLSKTICRIDKTLENEPEELIKGSWDILGINVYNNYIYFITLQEYENSNDTVDNKIHKMRIDGKEHSVINNNEFHNSCYELYVVKDKVYYIGQDEAIYTMNLDGSDKTKMDNTSTGFIGITDKYILYNSIDEEENIITHIMNIDGSNDRVLTGDRLYCADIIDDEIYYTDVNGHIFKLNIEEEETTMLSDIRSFCVNATTDGVYSLKYIDPELTQQAIFKLDLETQKEKMIKKLETTSDFLAVLDDWIVYMDTTDTKGIIAMVSKDGKKYQELYSIEFEEYMENLNLTDEEVQNIINGIVNEEQ